MIAAPPERVAPTAAPALVLRPQAGPQERYLASSADIAIYGGAAGGGKSWALLLEPLRHVANPRFGATFFRQNTTQIRAQGGLWDESATLYGPLGATPREQLLDWTFPSGAHIKFAHMQYESTKYEYQGAQIPLINWDELTHFSDAHPQPLHVWGAALRARDVQSRRRLVGGVLHRVVDRPGDRLSHP